MVWEQGAYLKDLLHRYYPTRVLHSAGESLLVVVLLAKDICLVGTQETAFSAVAPQLWSSLPLEARLAPSLLSLQMAVKMELFHQAFSKWFYKGNPPPCRGFYGGRVLFWFCWYFMSWMFV